MRKPWEERPASVLPSELLWVYVRFQTEPSIEQVHSQQGNARHRVLRPVRVRSERSFLVYQGSPWTTLQISLSNGFHEQFGTAFLIFAVRLLWWP